MKAHLWCGESLWEHAAYQDSVRGTSGCCKKYSQVITSIHYCFTLEQFPDTKSAVSILRSNSFWQDSVLRFSKSFVQILSSLMLDLTAGVFPVCMKISYDPPTDLHCNVYGLMQLSGVKPHVLFGNWETQDCFNSSERSTTDLNL